MGLEKPNKKQKKGLWSPDEDQKLRDYVLKNGHGCWTSLPIGAGLQRNGKSCRLRWINYLRPGLKRGKFSIAEEETILTLHQILGNKWSQIALHLPGRSDNEIKNYWHSCLKKRVAKRAETSRIGEIGGVQVWSSYIKSSPKVLFAEWVYTHGLENNVENHSSSNHEDTLLLNGGGTFGVDTNPKSSQVYVDNMLLLDYQPDYFPGELCINYDEFN